jgi:ABC-type Fe3+ transport system substrate-binding protein
MTAMVDGAAAGVAFRLRGLAVLGAVLALPFLLRPRENLLDESGETVVIVTPHNEAIRYEFARGFQKYMRLRNGRAVHVDWRTPGGTSEISRFLASEYAASFENYWKNQIRRPWTQATVAAFANPAIKPGEPGPDERDDVFARRTFLASDVGIGIDLFFGGGSSEFMTHAAAGRLVDAGIVKGHPELFNDQVIPEAVGGEPYWDRKGCWVGACLSAFGICYNRDSLARLAVVAPSGWSDLQGQAYFGQLALADPTKSGSAIKAFEMVIQQQMNVRAAELAGEGTAEIGELAEKAPREGWSRAMRLIRRISANARYFTDSATKIPIDVAVGDAAAGMCIDFQGRFQSEASTRGPKRLGFITPQGGTSMGADPIGLLRGAPHRELALEFMNYVLSTDGQKLWSFKVGTPGGPERYALRRLPILPDLYAPAYDAFRSDADENPYRQAGSFTYHPAWTGPLFRTIAFVVRVMCVDTQDELSRAYRALAERGFPARATALFDDVALVDYAAATGPIRAAMSSPNPVDEVLLANHLIEAFRGQYRTVAELAHQGL